MAVCHLVLGAPSGHADTTIGGYVGLAVPNWKLDTQLPVVTERHYRPGPGGAIFLRLEATKLLGLQLELGYANRGTKNVAGGMVVSDRSHHYLDLALTARLQWPSEPVSPYIVAGGAGSYQVHATLNGTDVTDEYQRWDASIRVGGGVDFGPFAWGTPSLEVRYDHGLVDLIKDNSALSYHNRTISILIGYEYRRGSDPDGDGVRGQRDRCPHQAEDRDDFEDADGCPDLDNDRDGIADVDDQCPMDVGPYPTGCPTREPSPGDRPAAGAPLPLAPPEDTTPHGRKGKR